MSPSPDPDSISRRVRPSRRASEFVPLDGEPAGTRALHMCPDCGSPLVHPVRWREAPAGVFELTLRCPNCARMTDGRFGREQVDALETELEAGVAVMLSDLRRLVGANLADEIERFAAALRSDLILPEDF